VKALIAKGDTMTPQERKDMPWIIGGCFFVGGVLCGAMIFRLWT